MHNRTVPAHVFDTHGEAHAAIQTLGNSGFDVGHLSVLGIRGSAVVVVGGISLLHNALAEVGVSRSHAIPFRTALEAGKFVLMVHGNAHEQARAAGLLADTAPIMR